MNSCHRIKSNSKACTKQNLKMCHKTKESKYKAQARESVKTKSFVHEHLMADCVQFSTISVLNAAT
ncbi:hypothetical protein Tsubulata_049278 [Turnera subulata]|uniref:Uncharacterized protein n=1 Tax=Turnera subulata TaxID=218843 RepID=A0A9Q0JQ80_9ROSI|nr:hypothetical protein Tsubulata_049278 [Turnera subulata]